MGTERGWGCCGWAIFASIDAGAPVAQAESCDKTHGRVESRKCEIPSCLGLFDTEQADQWPGQKTLVRATRSRGFYRKGQWVEQAETAYHLSSIAFQTNDSQIVDRQLVRRQRDSAGIHLAAVSQHWGSKTSSIMCLMSFWAKMIAMSEKIMRRRTCPSAEGQPLDSPPEISLANYPSILMRKP